MLGLICFTPNVIGTIKQNRMRWAEHVARMNAKGNAYAALVGNVKDGHFLDGRVILKWTLKKYGGRLNWIMWFRIRKSGEEL